VFATVPFGMFSGRAKSSFLNVVLSRLGSAMRGATKNGMITLKFHI